MKSFDTNVLVRLLVKDDPVQGQQAEEASGGADFSDHVIRESASAASALPVITFDRSFAREAGVLLLGTK